MIIKVIIFLFIALIIFSLGRGMYFLVTQNQPPQRMAKALTLRIILSLTLFVLLMIAFFMKWITPHGI